MSSLGYSLVTEAFNITSEQVSKQLNEINKLKQIINGQAEPFTANNLQNPEKKPLLLDGSEVLGPTIQKQPISNPVQISNSKKLFMELMNEPDFDQLIINYLKVFKPELLNTTTANKTNFINGISYFGNNNYSNNYLVFFIVFIGVYLLLVYYTSKHKR